MIETAEDKNPDKLFFVYLRDGRTLAVSAATFARRLNPDDQIYFFDQTGAPKEDIFVCATDTSAVAPDTSTYIPAPLLAMREDIEALKGQLDNLKNSLGEVVKQAVTAAFSQRGL